MLSSAQEVIFSPRRRPVDAVGAEPDAVVALDTGSVAARWGSGPPILLVHGWEGQAAQFGLVVARLLATGHAAVGVDGPGHGRAPDGPFSPVRHAAGLVEAAGRFGPFAGVVTHSFGSVATQVARVEGLRVPVLALLAPVRSMSEQVAGIADHYEMHGPRREEFLAMVEAGLDRPVADLDLDRGPAPTCPVLICHDRDDREVPLSSSQELTRVWPAADLRETAGLRHRGLLTDGATADAVVDHLLR